MALNPDACWKAVINKDKTQDGTFFFGVLSTGVYCRPSCPARRPLRQNVRFYGTIADAERDGLRACRRCRPAEPNERIRHICDFLRKHAASGELLSLERLGREAGISPLHLQRTFKAATGLTPRQYVEACRIEALKQGLREGDSVTGAIYEAGYGTASRVYERVGGILGMTPKQYRAGGGNIGITWTTLETPAGLIMIAATDRGLCFVQFGDSREELLARLREEFPAADLSAAGQPPSNQLAAWAQSLSEHLASGAPLDVPVDVRGTVFQHRVWRFLQTIPRGEVRSYSDVAAAIGAPSAVRAVAGACASNRVALAIPCHRVIRSSGELGGYRWGLERKRALLEQEHAGLIR